MDLTPAEIRVLGCLIEKQRTTPDTYPLTLNALRAACNQSTNRDPVVAYDEATIREAITRLNRRRWARLSSGAGSRTSKYRHLLDEALTRAPDELAVLCVLMLRGGQTPGELKARTERLSSFPDLADLQATLERLIARDLVAQLPRRPGQKEERYVHRLNDDDAPEPASRRRARRRPVAHAAAPLRAPGRPMPPAPVAAARRAAARRARRAPRGRGHAAARRAPGAARALAAW